MKNSAPGFSILILLIFFCLNCGQHKTGWEGTIEAINGVQIVRNPIRPLQPKMVIKFEEELTIGEEEGDENYMFGNEVALNVDEEGNFYVTDWDRKRIQKYDPEGSHLLTIGRHGEGPGEFQNISQVKFDSDSNLYVVDIVRRRISFFDPHGEILKTVQSPVGFDHGLYISAKGNYIFKEVKILDNPDGSGSFNSTYGLYDKQFNFISEFYREEKIYDPPSQDKNAMVKSLAQNMGEQAFKPRVSLIMDENDYVYLGYPEEYEIKIFNPEGKLEKIIQRNYKPIEVTPRDIESYAKNYKEVMFRFLSISDDIKEKVIQSAKYPKYKPAYKSFTLMDNGWLIVIADSLPGEYVLFDIFDEEGRYLTQFQSSISPSGLFFKRGKAYAVATENDFKFVKRYNYTIQEFPDN